ncbi:MAG: hypothetical protein IIT55_00085, partial [Bacteroidaceae bacterium]|nr:hypothetical protein [Bacteroidaceae bacterium]
MNIKQGIFRSFSLRLSLVVAFFTALMMVLIQLLQGWSAYRQVKSDATTESSMALRINTLEMNKSMILAEEISSDMSQWGLLFTVAIITIILSVAFLALTTLPANILLLANFKALT